MTAAATFKIENGAFALAVVDTDAVSYLDSWQAPAGKDVDTVALADYTDAVAQWSCQIQTMTIDATGNTNDETVDATWCEPQLIIPNPGQSSYAINGTYVHDAHTADSLQAFLYLHDTEEAYFFMGLAGFNAPPSAVGRCRILASSFGGAGHATLTGTIGALPLSRRYNLWHGAAPGMVINGLTNAERAGVVLLAATAAGGNGAPADTDDETAA